MFQSEEEKDNQTERDRIDFLKEQEKQTARLIRIGIIGFSIGVTLLIAFGEYLKTHH